MSIKATFPAGVTELTVNGLHQWNYGQQLEIAAEGLPAMVEVHFAHSGQRDAVVRSCAVVDGKLTAAIPDRSLEQTTPVVAWVYAIGETSGETILTVTMPIIARAQPQQTATVPEDVSDKYTEAVAAMDALVAEHQQITENAVEELSARVETSKEAITAEVLNDIRTNEDVSVPYADYADQAADAYTAEELKLSSQRYSSTTVNSVEITEEGLYLVEFIYGDYVGVSIIAALDSRRASAGTLSSEIGINDISACAQAVLDDTWILTVEHPGSPDGYLPIRAVYKIAELRKVASE